MTKKQKVRRRGQGVSLETTSENRAKLRRFVEELRLLVGEEKFRRKLRAFPPSISPDVAEFVAGAIEGYLAGHNSSLDHAFGLIKRPGRVWPSGGAGENFELAKHLFWMRWEGKSWDEIIAEYDPYGDKPRNHLRELQKILHRYEAKIVAELLAELKNTYSSY